MKTLKRYLSKIFAISYLQPLYKTLYFLALKGMNYGSANSPKYSGEVSLLKKLKNELPQNPVVFDVGANSGQYLDLILTILNSLQPIVHVFEPDEKAFSNLQKRYSNKENIYLNNFALGEKTKQALLYTSKDASVNASLVYDAKNLLKSTSILVKTLDSYCKEHDIKTVQFLKIDTEGYEINVLRGAEQQITNNNIQNIQIEHGSLQSIISGASLYRYQQILQHFKMFHIKQDGPYPLNYSPKNEIYYNSNYYFKLEKT